jgi:hypothetical protein
MNKKLNEKIVFGLIIFSILTFVVGCFSMAYAILKDDLTFDAIACWCMTICFVPLVSLQFFMSAGIYVSYFSTLHFVLKFLMFVIVFPAANIWLIVWSDIFLPFLPTHNSIVNIPEVLLLYATILWVILNATGLLVRYLKNRKTVVA